ncbi:MAG: glycosyltransferase [Bacteroidetes bacterium]|jgi:glycosyltransferase involved in cell wall biosynthesis|nr:glycosyltransferase [Bacteroidota bacterium]
MRIGLIIYGSINQQTGGYLYDRKLVEALRRDGHSVQLFSLPAGSYTAHLADNLRLGFAQRIAAANLDILLEDELNHPSLFLLNHLLRTACRCPIISIVHHLRASEQHPDLAQLLYRPVERQYLESVDGFIFNSHATKDAVYDLAPSVRSDPYTVAWPGRPEVHDERPAPTGSSATDRVVLLFVGSIIERKGLRELAYALQDIPPDQWSLHVAGDDTVDPDYASTCKHLLRNTQGDVHWHGFVSDLELKRLYREADVLAVPSFHEGFGIVYLEAMGYGLPVIAARSGGASDFVRNGQNGFLVDPEAQATITHRIEQLLQPSTRRSMCRDALASYRHHPSWDDSMCKAAKSIYTYINT